MFYKQIFVFKTTRPFLLFLSLTSLFLPSHPNKRKPLVFSFCNLFCNNLSAYLVPSAPLRVYVKLCCLWSKDCSDNPGQPYSDWLFTQNKVSLLFFLLGRFCKYRINLCVSDSTQILTFCFCFVSLQLK